MEKIARKASRKGLSPLLAIIIGLVVTIVAGMLLAQLYFSYAATLSSRPAANVEYVDLVVPTGSTSGTLVISIKKHR
jgi:flagellin-like protein